MNESPYNMHIFFVNGPPRSGKDTVGKMLTDHLGARVDKFARILKERTHALYGAVNAETGAPVAHDFFEAVKDDPHPIFMGLTPRQAYIHVSETYFKPVHGDVIFGTMLANELEMLPPDQFFGVHAITDSGFVGEAEEIMRRWPDAKVTVLHIEREGCDFSGDSRGYINMLDPNSSLEPRPVQTIKIVNNDTLDDLRNEVINVVAPLLGIEVPSRYILEVQVPGPEECGCAPEWITFGATDDYDHALAQAETSRRSHYGERVVRVTDQFSENIESTRRYIYPGDPAAYTLGSVPA